MIRTLTLRNVPKILDSVSLAELPSVTLSEVKKSPFSQYKKSKDVVSQVVSLSRSNVASNDSVWQQVADTVTHSLPRMDAADFATIVKNCSISGFRDELMLVGICESIKHLCVMGKVRPRNLADLVSGFHRLNFVPSVEVLNGFANQTEKAIKLYRTRPLDICKLFRYFSIIESNPHLCVGYESRFIGQQILRCLEAEIEQRIGFFGPIEIAILARYATRIPLKRLVENFARTENCPTQVRDYFLRQLDRRFGQDAWKQYQYLLRPTMSDSTGWDRSPRREEDDCDEDDTIAPVKSKRSDFPLFSVDEIKVDAVLNSVKVVDDLRRPKSHSESVSPKTIHEICAAQFEALSMLEEEVGLERVPTLATYTDRIDKRDKRVDDRRDYLRKKCSRNLKRLKRFRKMKKFALVKFSYLATARRKLV